MLVELTGDATYLLPIMFCSVVGKFTSDAIEPPLYPQHMALEKIPSLTDKLNPVIARLTAKDIMLTAKKC
jgi:H+/Cl- antiporter ClcA